MVREKRSLARDSSWIFCPGCVAPTMDGSRDCVTGCHRAGAPRCWTAVSGSCASPAGRPPVPRRAKRDEIGATRRRASEKERERGAFQTRNLTRNTQSHASGRATRYERLNAGANASRYVHRETFEPRGARLCRPVSSRGNCSADR